jgi:hypothetical protein
LRIDLSRIADRAVIDLIESIALFANVADTHADDVSTRKDANRRPHTRSAAWITALYFGMKTVVGDDVAVGLEPDLAKLALRFGRDGICPAVVAVRHGRSR